MEGVCPCPYADFFTLTVFRIKAIACMYLEVTAPG
jgi:hypothetical protein